MPENVPVTAAPLRTLVVGAGGMGRGWINTVGAHPGTVLVGVVDIDTARAAEAAASAGGGIPVFADLDAALDAGLAIDLLVDVTIPEAHHLVTLAALRAGIPVLGEKPAAATLAEAVQLAAASELADVPFVVSQNRRYEPNAQSTRAAIQVVGAPGLVDISFAKAPHFGGFREEMEHVLLLDMSIHHFDYLRHAMGSDPVVEVYCDEFNPAWSWFRHGAATTLLLRFASGARATYTASWCSPGAETSWNAHWRFSGPAGTVVWNGDNAPEVDVPNDASVVAPVVDGPTGLAASLTLMVDYLRGGPEPTTTVRDNVSSLALVFAAIESACVHQPVRVADVIERARADAAASADSPELAEAVRALTL
ncbi:MAG TPA: Gfo/Idh/MocA family oxidoreductase [Actinopolymorphaceae bacterium]|jgi:predicted dehydrogenase